MTCSGLPSFPYEILTGHIPDLNKGQTWWFYSMKYWETGDIYIIDTMVLWLDEKTVSMFVDVDGQYGTYEHFTNIQLL